MILSKYCRIQKKSIYIALNDHTNFDDSKRVAGKLIGPPIRDKYAIGWKTTVINIGTVSAHRLRDHLAAGHNTLVAFIVDTNVSDGRLVSTTPETNEHLVVGLEHGIAVVEIGRMTGLCQPHALKVWRHELKHKQITIMCP